MTIPLFKSNCIPYKSYPVNGYLFNRAIESSVDHPLAVEILNDLSSDIVQKFFNEYKNEPLTTETLKSIAEKYSMDVSTLYFLQIAYQNPQNNKAQDSYHTNLDQLNSQNLKESLIPLKDYYAVFIPGLNYHDSSNGGDFYKQRKLLTECGVKNELVLTKNWGLVDENAKIVADRLRELNQLHKKIIVVSASKGGLETAVALGKLLNQVDTESIKAWVSVGGILKGSPVADKFLKWPKCWIAEIGLLFVGQRIGLIKDVSYKKRSAEFEDFNFPGQLKRIHFVGAPLSTQIHKRIKSNYCSIKELGPNDGITPLADETTNEGIIVSELGFDHYYQHPEIDKKTIALALTIVQTNNSTHE